ncbi:cytochrome P450 [Gloeopeniophorella convolvens]|nr:cytochrome P450 [Gloeopeniophorella convolvens]
MGSMYVQLVGVLLFSCIVYVIARKRPRPPLPYPPGPKGLPLIGNLLDMPRTYQWLTYERWGKEFNSDIVHVELPGMHIVVLNSAKAANELLGERSSIYSDRPQLKAITVLLEAANWSIFSFPYGPKWKAWRKAFYAHFQPSAAQQYHPAQTRAARRLLRNLRDAPDDFAQHLRHFTGQLSFATAYGIDVAPRDDPYLAMGEEALRGAADAQTRGRLFNLLPFLVHMPWWFPGAGFKKDAPMWARKINLCRDAPYEDVRRAIDENKATPSVAASMISALHEGSTPEEQLMARTLPANVFFAGVETTYAVLHTFVLAMVLHPAAQQRAHAELDAVLGRGRLPTHADAPALPYTTALLHEVLRWRPAVPLGLPHRLTQDDVYAGYHLPTGTMLFANAHAILRDARTYGPDAASFRPERFLPPAPASLPDAAFGFGRRACPGRAAALDAAWAAIAGMLAAFKFVPVEGESAPAEAFVPRLVSGPLSFRCTIRARDGVDVAALDD